MTARASSAAADKPRVVRATVAALGARGLPLDLDGDHAGSFRGLEIGVAPGALAVIG
jgi:hypothetical protein